ncbi:hypothetical protein B0T21DRAFT_381841 [Apiosordaria backusii]|uniref:NECAP PHear domain-containing protein n=1 Tax=Apiosordaria backusii TaxID=314023 RepID=A0AA40K163_9PEZI|nr:hypothetical protein B0T21DRAFT_381841 [Apiosordaria backusii]
MDSTTIDPATGQPLPPDAIVRVLHITNKVHIYTLPPQSPTTAYLASSWTALPQNPIFTARLRILETSLSPDDAPSSPQLKVDILLESTTSSTTPSSTGSPQLFAAAPYTTPAIVTPCTDSSRFFALRVSDPQSGKKASLGIGFEERSDAFDFNLALQECGKALNFPGFGGQQQQQQSQEKKKGKEQQEERKDWSLKEGETITINLGGKFGRRQQGQQGGQEKKKEEGNEGKSLNSFALPPPPGSSSSSGGGGSGGFGLPPPPSASEARRQKRLSAQQMGFDDGQFGEFA